MRGSAGSSQQETGNASQQQNETQSEEQGENSITSALQELNDEEKQSYEQWMRRVPDDPSGLLRRKFEQQSYERRRQGGARQLNEGEPIW